MVIISHTDGFYTLTAGVSRFLVSKGDIVEAGDPVAMTSGHVGELAEPIHFEIRQRNTALDPLKWFAADKIVVAVAGAKSPPPALAEPNDLDQK